MNKQETPNLNNNEITPLVPKEQVSGPVEGAQDDPFDKAEKTLDSLGNMATQAQKSTREVLDVIDRKPLSISQKDTFKTKLHEGIKKIAQVFSFATLLTSAAIIADHELTRYKITSTVEKNGKISYSHEDPETTHVINVLAGKEKLHDIEKKSILIDYLERRLDLPFFQNHPKYHDLNKKGLLGMSLDELMKIKQELMDFFKYIEPINIDPGPQNFDPELYDVLWKLSKECGSPKVNFKLLDKKSIFGFYGTGNNFYDPLTNTIFINIGDNESTIDAYLSELSHGKQFNEKPVTSNLLSARDLLKSIKDGVLDKGNFVTPKVDTIVRRIDISIQNKYNSLYDDPETVEYEAHKIIEPKLRAELYAKTPTMVAERKIKKTDKSSVIDPQKLK
jgi:hypothetical protein